MMAAAVLILWGLDSGRAIAKELFRAGDYRQAALKYIELLRTSPTDPDLLDAAGQSLLRMGAPGQAVTFFEHEVALQPLNRSAMGSLSEALLQAGRTDDARQLLSRLVSEDASDGNSWARLGLLSYRSGYYPAAIQAFDHALKAGARFEAETNRNQIEVLRAVSLVEAGSLAQAAISLPALLARPENAGNLDLLLSDVRRLYESGRPEEALKQSEKALAASPTNAAAHFWRARLFQQAGAMGLAVSEAERARELSPGSPAPRALLVRLYEKSGRSADATKEATWLREHESQSELPKPQ